VLADDNRGRGVPKHVRSDNGPEFSAKAVRAWLERIGVQTLFIEPGSPWENGSAESFNGTLRDEVLNREIFYSLKEAQVLIEVWRNEHNTIRPHSSLGYRPPAPSTTAGLPRGRAAVEACSAALRSPPPRVQITDRYRRVPERVQRRAVRARVGVLRQHRLQQRRLVL
jgi:hypothetical protein